MGFFGWLALYPGPPCHWDLLRQDWQLCHGQQGCHAECRHVLVCDVRDSDPAIRAAIAEADRPAWRLILLGVEEGAERAALLGRGCAEALPGSISLRELEARVKRVSEMFAMLPRWRNIGPLVLDLFHRDARHGARWLNLHPREFGVLWRLADQPGARVTRRSLITDVWRLNHEPETNSVEVHVSRLRAKLARADCAELVETSPEGGYRLALKDGFMFSRPAAEADALDRYLRELGWACAAVE